MGCLHVQHMGKEAPIWGVSRQMPSADASASGAETSAEGSMHIGTGNIRSFRSPLQQNGCGAKLQRLALDLPARADSVGAITVVASQSCSV